MHFYGFNLLIRLLLVILSFYSIFIRSKFMHIYKNNSKCIEQKCLKEEEANDCMMKINDL